MPRSSSKFLSADTYPRPRFIRISMWSLPPSETVAMWASGSRISTSPSAWMSRARLVHLDRQGLGMVDVQLQRNLLQVQDDVGGVLDDSWNRRELVEHAVDL